MELLFQSQRQHQANQNELAEAIEAAEKPRIEQHKQLLLEGLRQNEKLTKQREDGENHTTEQVKAMYEQSTTTLRLEMQYELEKIRKESLAQAVRAQTPAASLHPTFAAYRPPEITRPKEEVVKERREREEKYERNLATILAAQPVVSAKALYNPPILNQYETFREWKAATSEWAILNSNIPGLQKIFLIKHHHKQTPGNGKLNALIKKHLDDMITDAKNPVAEVTLSVLLEKIKPAYTLAEYEEAEKLQAILNKFAERRHPEETASECFKKLKKLAEDLKAVGRSVGYHEFLRIFTSCSVVDKSLENYLVFNMNNASVEDIERALEVKDSLKFQNGTRAGLLNRGGASKARKSNQWVRYAAQDSDDSWGNSAEIGQQGQQDVNVVKSGKGEWSARPNKGNHKSKGKSSSKDVGKAPVPQPGGDDGRWKQAKGQPGTSGECWECGEKGHFARECYKKQPKGKGQGKGKSSAQRRGKATGKGKAGAGKGNKGKGKGKSPKGGKKGKGGKEQKDLTVRIVNLATAVQTQGKTVCFVNSDHLGGGRLAAGADGQFGGVIDTGFNGNALLSSHWLAKYEKYMAEKGHKPFKRVIAPQINFVFGGGEVRSSNTAVELPVWCEDKWEFINARLIKGNLELLLGMKFIASKRLIIDSWKKRVKFGHGKWRKVILNAKDHLVLPVVPMGAESESQKRRTRRAVKARSEGPVEERGYQYAALDTVCVGHICSELNKGLKSQIKALRNDLRAGSTNGMKVRQDTTAADCPPADPSGQKAEVPEAPSEALRAKDSSGASEGEARGAGPEGEDWVEQQLKRALQEPELELEVSAVEESKRQEFEDTFARYMEANMPKDGKDVDPYEEHSNKHAKLPAMKEWHSYDMEDPDVVRRLTAKLHHNTRCLP